MLAFVLKIVFRLTALVPLSVAHFFGAMAGRLVYLIPNSARHVAKKNIELCLPELNSQEQQKLLRDSLTETGKTLAEMGTMWLSDYKRTLNLVTSVDGEEHLKTALEKGNGVLLAMPHIGSWELVNLYVAKHYPVTSLYKPPHQKGLDNLIRTSRQRTGATLVPTNTKGVRAVSKALKNDEVVVILPDQQPYLHHKNGLFANFFGSPAYSMTLMSKLAEKSDSEIVYAYTKRLPKGKGFKLVFMPASINDNKQDLQHSVELMNLDIEKVVLDCPSQYQWTYKRFKARPEGYQKLY